MASCVVPAERRGRGGALWDNVGLYGFAVAESLEKCDTTCGKKKVEGIFDNYIEISFLWPGPAPAGGQNMSSGIPVVDVKSRRGFTPTIGMVAALMVGGFFLRDA